MNILCVGNSFAVDASTYVHQLAKAAGRDIDIYVLYIGGCPINLHWKNFQSGAKDYEFYSNGTRNPLMWCDIFEGLRYQTWDYITFQQRSGDSVDANTFFPELTYLMNEIRKMSKAEFALHKTWSYSINFSHDKYGSNPMDQDAMSRDIESAYDTVSLKSGIKNIIPSGTAIAEARKVFGDALDRDGYHLNERGRTLAGLVWVYYFLGVDIDVSSFEPSGYTYDDVTPPVSKEEFKTLCEIAKKVVLNNKGHNIW